MNILWLFLSWVIGIGAGAFLLAQSLIVVFFAIPFTARLNRLGVIKSNAPLVRYFTSFVVLVALFVTVTMGVRRWLNDYVISYYIGVGLTLFFALGKLGANPANVQDYFESNASYVDKDALNRAFPTPRPNTRLLLTSAMDGVTLSASGYQRNPNTPAAWREGARSRSARR